MLREDNADLRLSETGRQLGLVDDARWEAFARKRDAIAREEQRLKSTWVNPSIVEKAKAERVLGHALEREHTLYDLLRRPSVSYRSLNELTCYDANVEDDVAEQLEIQAKYQGYIERQNEEVRRTAALEQMALPADLDYADVRGLSNEVQQKLSRHKPETVGQASRISGVTPAAVSLLLVHLKRRSGEARRKKTA
jgi:tRNA uridine 5-carboxymethylaminomethyl modification enzyme